MLVRSQDIFYHLQIIRIFFIEKQLTKINLISYGRCRRCVLKLRLHRELLHKADLLSLWNWALTIAISLHFAHVSRTEWVAWSKGNFLAPWIGSDRFVLIQKAFSVSQRAISSQIWLHLIDNLISLLLRIRISKRFFVWSIILETTGVLHRLMFICRVFNFQVLFNLISH